MILSLAALLHRARTYRGKVEPEHVGVDDLDILEVSELLLENVYEEPIHLHRNDAPCRSGDHGRKDTDA